MLYFQHNGTAYNRKLIDNYRKLENVSSYFKGEQCEYLSLDDAYVVRPDSMGLKVIDFTVFDKLRLVNDINKADFLPTLLKVVKRANDYLKKHELLIMLPALARNDDVSVRSKMLNELRIGALGKFKISKSDSLYKSHRSNPLIFLCGEVIVSFNSLDPEITDKILNGDRYGYSV